METLAATYIISIIVAYSIIGYLSVNHSRYIDAHEWSLRLMRGDRT
jgi:hypothetical protein